ncbi:MAG: STM4015 family protein [Anaerolineae bacterium]|jgi:hypothetical protein|nr:STM4015 family protein [Anaerolineae bacterium]
MAISEHLRSFAGKSVVDWSPDEFDPQDPLNLDVFYRIAIGWDSESDWGYHFARFLAHPNVAQITGIVIGHWASDFDQRDSSPIVEALVNARLPHLKAIFLGDITYEENELSWIIQSDIAPLFEAYPQLEHLGVRGGEGLIFNVIQHAALKSLTVQTGGLDIRILQDLARSDLPNLESLELWLGTSGYGWNGTIDDVARFIQSLDRFPKLSALGLCDSEIADEIAQQIVNSTLLDQISSLDFSFGTFGDEGAEALINSPKTLKLKTLRLEHHFCSDAIVEKLGQLPIEVVIFNQRQPDTYDNQRYVLNGE